MSDEGFHEIQLGGKQLVFLFMAAAVVGVVLFLAGVMVGRGVRTEVAALAPGGAPVAADLSAAGAEPPAPAPGGQRTAPPAGDPTAARPAAPPSMPPPPVADDIPRATAPGEPAGATKAPAPAAASPRQGRHFGTRPRNGCEECGRGRDGRQTRRRASPRQRPRSLRRGVPSPLRASSRSRSRPRRTVPPPRRSPGGWSARGTPPTCSSRAAGSASPIYYRVRVGPFKTRRDADETRRRLEKEEQFKPFITR